MTENIAAAIEGFLAHKRALGRKYQTEERTLHLLLAFADQHAVIDLPGSPLVCWMSSIPPDQGPEPEASIISLGSSAASSTGLSASNVWMQHPGAELDAGRRNFVCRSCSISSKLGGCSELRRPCRTTPEPPVVVRPITPSLPCATASGSELGKHAVFGWTMSIPIGSF